MVAVAFKLKNYQEETVTEQKYIDTAAKIALEKVYTGYYERLNKKEREVNYIGEFCGVTVSISMGFEGLTPIICMAVYNDYVKNRNYRLIAYMNVLQPKEEWWFARMLHHEERCKDVPARIHELTSSHNINSEMLEPHWQRLMQMYNVGSLDLF
jgi:hypothetical protein